jgi:hypothetical protein
VGLLKPPHLGTFKVRYTHGKIVEHQGILPYHSLSFMHVHKFMGS